MTEDDVDFLSVRCLSFYFAYPLLLDPGEISVDNFALGKLLFLPVGWDCRNVLPDVYYRDNMVFGRADRKIDGSCKTADTRAKIRQSPEKRI